MPDPRELLDAYAAIRTIAPLESSDPPDEHGDYRAELSDIAPKTFAALRAVLDLHSPDDDGRYCIECGVDVSENEIPWPCDTVQAITTALEGDHD